ncbi:MAG: hypothetical protein J6R08_06795 [Opitutales bacterium]|nr:hypothetical protein [Opitutales bacterium]
MAKNETNLNGKLDDEAVEVMTKQVAKGVASDDQILRVLVNLFSEMLGELKTMSTNISKLNSAWILSNRDKIMSALGKRS